MIKAKDAQRFVDLSFLLTEAEKRLGDLKAERNDLQEKLTNQVLAAQRYESACVYVLTTEQKDKTFIPPYKDCATELAGEGAVKAWVKKNHPHKTYFKLEAQPRRGKLQRLSTRVTQILERLTALKTAA